MTNKQTQLLRSHEGGYASFVITLITLIVVSLIVIAFASDSRVEQKNSLASNLATEAYYAAQSGINDAYSIIEADINSGITPVSTGSNCATNGSSYLKNSSNQLTSNIQYSCLIVNTTPSTLEYQDILPGRSLVVPISNSSSGANSNIGTITISWEYYQSSINGGNLSFLGCPNNTTGSANLPALNSTGSNNFNPTNCGAPLMQVDYVSANNIGSAGSANTGTIFFEPISNGGGASDPTITPGSRDTVYDVYCNEASPAGNGLYACTQTFNPSAGGVGDSTYYLHIQTFYQPANISINATNTGGGAVSLNDAQIDIDATGEASSQLKRLDERVCYGEFCDSLSPSGAIESTQCINKEFSVYPGGPSSNPGKPAGC